MINDIKTCVQRGNIHRDLNWLQKGLPFVPCYVANGAVGGCVDEFGLHSLRNYDMDFGRTHLTHVDHYSKRHDNGGHVLRSFGHMLATDGLGRAPGLGLLKVWDQELDLWTASCRTAWTEESSYTTEVFASWATPQLWCWKLEQKLANPAHALSLCFVFDVRDAENNSRVHTNKYIHELSVEFESVAADTWKVISHTDCCDTEMLLHVIGGEVEIDGTDLVIAGGVDGVELRALFLDQHLSEADPVAFLACNDHRQAHEAAVAKHWHDSGLIELPADTPEACWWLLYAYYLPASLSPNPSHIQVATGLNANNWGHGFPQDQWYVMMALPRLGLHDLNAAQMPYYNDDLAAYERYTKRMCKRDGVFFPWEAPFEKLDEFELDGMTNHNSYQFHNAAYVVAMVWESYLIHRKADYLKTHAGLIEGVARFFAANCEAGENGYIFRNDDVLLRSQDEATVHGAETVQPLCSIWGSLYTFKAYLQCCDELGCDDAELKARVRKILDTGFDFSGLLRDDGSLRTSATDPRPFGQQKHPPQLNPITYVPMADWMDYEPVERSWHKRHQLCTGTRIPKSLGWTFGQFLLASARMRDGAAAEIDLNLVQPARFADAEWIQFFETSCRHGWSQKSAYYFTTMGLYTMAMVDTLIQDYRDGIDVLPALLPRWQGKPVAFRNLHLRNGIVADGRLSDGTLELELRASRDIATTLRVHRADAEPIEKDIELTAGERLTITETL